MIKLDFFQVELFVELNNSLKRISEIEWSIKLNNGLFLIEWYFQMTQNNNFELNIELNGFWAKF